MTIFCVFQLHVGVKKNIYVYISTHIYIDYVVKMLWNMDIYFYTYIILPVVGKTDAEVVDTTMFERVNIIPEKTRTFESKYLSFLHRRRWRAVDLVINVFR